MSDQNMACAELVEAITDYIEGTLTATQRARVDEHLEECLGCRAYLEQMRDTIDLLATLANDPSPPRDLAKLLDVFRRQRSNNDGD